MVPRSCVVIVSTCFLLIFNLLMLIGCKKHGGTNIIISGGSGGCGDSWSSGGCGKGNIILTNSDKKGKGDKIIITGGGGGGHCCGWKAHPRHDHSWKPIVVPIKVPSYHSHWPVTNWPHTPSWSHHTLGHSHSHSHHHDSHKPPHHHHPLLNWDKHESILSTDIWDKPVHHSPDLPHHHHHLHGDHHELPATHHLDHSPWTDWTDSSSVSSSWSKKNDFTSIDELTEPSWNEIWR